MKKKLFITMFLLGVLLCAPLFSQDFDICSSTFPDGVRFTYSD
jgi:hypothetical protein